MLKISDILDIIISSNRFFQVGLSHRLFNLTKLADFMKPLIEARLKKEVSGPAIVMALSRVQKRFDPLPVEGEAFKIRSLNVHGKLFSATFDKSKKSHDQLNRFYKHLMERSAFSTFTESSSEITIIAEEYFLEKLNTSVALAPTALNLNVVGIGVQFDPSYVKIPGFLYLILQKLAVQHINIVEVASTNSEFMVYVSEKDTKLAFETLMTCF